MCQMALLVHVRTGSFFFKALGITLLFMAGFSDDQVRKETKYRNLALLRKYYRYSYLSTFLPALVITVGPCSGVSVTVHSVAYMQCDGSGFTSHFLILMLVEFSSGI